MSANVGSSGGTTKARFSGLASISGMSVQRAA